MDSWNHQFVTIAEPGNHERSITQPYVKPAEMVNAIVDLEPVRVQLLLAHHMASLHQHLPRYRHLQFQQGHEHVVERWNFNFVSISVLS